MSILRLVPRVLPLAVAATLVFVSTASAEMPQINSAATITGSAVVGGQLTAHNGTWLYADGTSCKEDCVLSYQWQRCNSGGGACGDIGGATGRFYTVQQADAGSRLRVMETMGKQDCGEWNYSTGTRECRWDARSAPSSPTAVVPGSAPTAPSPPSSPTPPAAPQPPAALAPTATAAPAISGIPMVDETLTATKGLWSGTAPLTIALEWLRCDAAGQNCETLGLSGESYKVIGYDVGKTLRVRITASNAAATRTALSDATAVVSELKPTESKPWIAAANVVAPHRLAINSWTVAPRRLAGRTTIRLSLRVDDTRGFRVAGALVTVVALPQAAFRKAVEVTTDESGMATVTLPPAVKLNPKKTRAVKLIVTARRPGDRLSSPRAALLRVSLPVTSR